jgi:hypothetical protein
VGGQVTAGAAVITRRCNPYGHETGGPRHLLGGLYGPEHEGPQKWHCENPAEVRCRMKCAFGHRGQIMNLCRSHAIEIQRRQADLCPKCAWPPAAVGINEAMNYLQREITALAAQGEMAGLLVAGSGTLVPAGRMRQLTRQLEQHQEQMTELWRSGAIKKTPLRLEEIS